MRKELNNLLPLIFIFFMSLNSLNAQYKIVDFDYEKASFNNNQSLPAETQLLIQGDIPKTVDYIELAVLEAKGREKRKALYETLWKRPFEQNTNRFNLPLNYKLRGNTAYDFEFRFYATISANEEQQLLDQLFSHLDTYLEQTFDLKKKSIKLNRSVKEIMEDLNMIVETDLKYYRNYSSIDFEGFSEIVEQTIKRLEKANLKKGKLLFLGKTKEESRLEYKEKLVADLKRMVFSELETYMDQKWMKLMDSRYVNDYATEKTRRILSIQAGYAGVYIEGNTNNLSLGSAPFAGLSFPLGKKAFAPKILSNTSLTFGAFITNFNNVGPNNEDWSGPIFRRPTYVGLSYKVYQFIYLNAGATFLENVNTAGQINNLGSRVLIRPNLGLSLQVNLWADLSR
jgi:hypothetical protein